MIAAVAAAVALAGWGQGFQTARPVTERLRGPEVPAPGALPGTLYVAGQGCRLRALRLDEVTVERLEAESGCAPGPEPRSTLVTLVDEPGARRVAVGGETVLETPDLARAARASESELVHPLGADLRADGLLAVTVAAAPRGVADLLAERGLDVDELRTGQIREALGLEGEYGAMALSGSGTLPRLELQLWRGPRLVRTAPLPPLGYPGERRRFGELVRFAPGGLELAVGRPGRGGTVMLVDVRSGRQTLPPTQADSFAWSPDGAWFALAAGGGVTVSGTIRSEAAYVLPLRATTLVWRE